MTSPFSPPVPAPLHGPHWTRPPALHEFRVTQTYNHVNPKYPESKHKALDLGNGRLGDDVLAPRAGIVIAEGWLREPWSGSTDAFGTGNFGGIMVVIDHGNGWYSGLAHMSKSIVNEGQHVKRGQKVGVVGDTGSAKGAGHLHWDLYHGEHVERLSLSQARSHLVNAWPLLQQFWKATDAAVEAALKATQERHPTEALSALARAEERLRKTRRELRR